MMPAPRAISGVAAVGITGVAVALTARCNLRCSYCYQRRDDTRTMSWPTLRAVMDLLLASGTAEPELGFSGGEPLLALPLMQRAACYLAKCAPPWALPRLSVTTNGTLVDEKALHFLAGSRVRMLLSFDGVAVSQEMRAAGTFSPLDTLLDRLQADYPGYLSDDVTVSMTLSSANVGYLAASVGYFLARGVSSFTVAPVETDDPGWSDAAYGELDRQLAVSAALCREYRRRTGAMPFDLLRRHPARWPRRRRNVPMCRIADGSGVFVDVGGEVVTCAAFALSYAALPTDLARRAAAAARVGHITDNDLTERLARCRQELAQVGVFGAKERKGSPYGTCGECRALHQCLICPMSIAAQPGNEDPDRVPPLPCALNLLAAKYRRFPPQPSW